eukprot:Partr_v1_DN27078_c2_g2_i1_m29222
MVVSKSANPSTRLPPEMLLLVFSHLTSPKDLASCSRVCRNWNRVVGGQSLWQKWCSEYWVPIPPTTDRENIKEKDKERFTRWPAVSNELQRMSREVFVDWFKRFSAFHEFYPQIKGLTFRMSQWLRLHSTATYLTLMPGKTGFDWDDMVDELGARWNVTISHLPAEFRQFLLFYHFFDGQKPRMPHVDAGLFGTYSCYGQYSSVFMLPSKHIKLESICGMKVVVFAVCPRSGKYISLVLSAPGNEHLQNNIVFLDEGHKLYIAHGTFMEWFTRYVNDLENFNYDIGDPEGAISIFPNSGPYCSAIETHGIEVIASAMYQTEATSLHSMWVYQIKFVYHAGHSPCQLVSRHLVIEYASGRREPDSSDAVAGQTPELGNHSKTHTYCEYVYLQ